MSQPRTRQELYDLIKEQGKNSFILDEMKKLGFWEDDKEKPSLPEQLIKRQDGLRKEIQDLARKQARLDDPEQAIKDYRQKRMAESRAKQEENRERREEERKAKAAAWQERKAKEILYLGEGISFGLSDKTSNPTQLAKYGLTDYQEALELAEAIGIPLNKLQFLAYNRKVSTISHYQRFYMEKKTGGQRLISAPMPLLKQVQYWVLENILNKIPVHANAHGFKAGSSIVSNARPHVGKDLVVNLDFKDFFPTISFVRVKGCFQQLGYSSHIATILASICTEPDVDQIELDGQTYFVAKGDRVLPQGAPTSPVLTNIIGYKMDTRFTGIAQKNGFVYTRYADDLSFSASGEAVENLTKVLWAIRQITKDEGFVLHPEKLRIMRKGARQEVTGIVVNRELGIDRRTLRKFRALLHSIKQTGWEGKQWGKGGSNILFSVYGYAQFVSMVKPEKGQALLNEIEALREQWKMEKPATPKKSSQEVENKLKDIEAKSGSVDTPTPTQEPETSKAEKSTKPRWKLW